MAQRRYNYNNPKPTRWHEGERYDISVANNLLYTNNEGSRGKVTVFIRDKWEGNKIHQRTGDAQMIGNFSPIWINWKGKKVTIEDMLKKKV